ncbi:hypothetical protein CEXT_184411 [Caerostris extrusa]|uniref:Uncharacterized protein n=1 Tax=Caerostris extrusa TaxID=172846 RepID=A0AAV4V468_CAEEX|nr:hypothetical protein CEXT_184411 [Caerostris extrusa]
MPSERDRHPALAPCDVAPSDRFESRKKVVKVIYSPLNSTGRSTLRTRAVATAKRGLMFLLLSVHISKSMCLLHRKTCIDTSFVIVLQI